MKQSPSTADPLRNADAQLVRAIGVPGLTANIVNTTIGAGIFVIPAAVAATLGTDAPIAFLLCAVAMGLIVTCFALAGSRVSLSGGLYSYVEVAFGSYVGFLAGILSFVTFVLGAASVGAAFAGAAAVAFPILGTGPNRLLLLLAVFAAFALFNIVGVRYGTRLMGLLTLIKLGPLLLFVAVGIFAVDWQHLAPMTWPQGSAVGKSVLLLIFAFSGIEIALVPSGEVANPSRTVPRAIFGAMLTTTTLYLAIQLIAQGILGSDLAKFSAAPLAEAAGRTSAGNFGHSVLLGAGAISALGFISGDILSSPRMIYAFSRDGFLPVFLSKVHPRFRTPYVAIATYVLIGLAGAASGTFERLAILSNIALLLLYLFCAAATWQLIRRDVRLTGEPLRLPGQVLVPFLAAGVCGWILLQAEWREFIAAGIVFAAATVIYFARRLLKRPT